MKKIDSIDSYFREIGDQDLLTREEEVSLGERIKKGDEEAERALARGNYKLVIEFAKRYKDFGVPFSDLIGYGNLGLMKAVKSFDPKKGKFSSYAPHWIRNKILKGMDETNNQIHIPKYLKGKIKDVKELQRKYYKKHGEFPDGEYIKEELDVDDGRWGNLRKALLISNVKSLDRVIENDNEKTFAELKKGDHDVEDEALGGILRERLERYLNSNLTEREERIIREYYGLGNGGGKSLKEVGNEMDISYEWVRQLRDRGIEKLKSSSEERDSLEALWKRF